MHPENLNKTARRHSICLLMLGLSVLCAVPHRLDAATGTKFRQIRLAVHPGFTRLVFDAEGDRPVSVGPSTDMRINIEFAQMAPDALAKGNINFSRSALSGIELQRSDGSSRITISFRMSGTTVKHQFLAAQPPSAGRYRLLLDFFPPSATETGERKHSETKAAPAPQNGKEKDPLKNYLQPAAAAPPDTLLDTSAGNKGKRARGTSRERVNGSRSKVLTDNGLPVQGVRREPPPPDSESVAALYDQADTFFAEHEKTLSQDAPEVVAKYVSALAAGPKSARAPVALYRCGLSYLAVVNLSRAEKSFREVLSSWPDSSVAPNSWLGLGQIHLRRNSQIEAIEAFRSALKFPMEKADQAFAHYQLGVAFYNAGIYKEAEEMLNMAVNEDPFLYIRNPGLLKTFGEVYFGRQKYDKSREYLLRYLNIQPDPVGRDLILAKIAETFLAEGDQATASRLYNYVRRDFPDSEGSFVSSIRLAELMEKDERKGIDTAINIYTELSEKNPPPALRNMVNLKLAGWQYKRGNYDKSMEFIDQVIRGKPDSSIYTETVALRDLVLTGWLKKAFSDKDYPLVIQVYDKYLPLFKALQSAELDAMAADGYAALKIHTAALEILERLISASKTKNDEWLFKAAQNALLSGEPDKAVQYCKQIQSASFDNRKSEILAGIYYRQGKYGDAVKSFAKVFLNDNDYQDVSFDSLMSYIKSLIELKKFEDALAIIQKAQPRMEKEAAESRIHICLLTSKCRQEIKQLEQAIESLEAALALTSDEEQTALINYEISRLYLALGQSDKATEKLNAILGTSFSFWKTAAQQQLDAIYMSKQQQAESASTKQ